MSSIASRRFLADRVMTATPAQRVVMLYDRAILDLSRAERDFGVGEAPAAAEQVMHALAIVSELRAVLDTTSWDGAGALGSLYDWMITELISCRTGDGAGRLTRIGQLLGELRAAWAQAAEQVSGLAPVALGSAV